MQLPPGHKTCFGELSTGVWWKVNPRVDVCARAKRGWKSHTRPKSPCRSRIELYFFIRRVGDSRTSGVCHLSESSATKRRVRVHLCSARVSYTIFGQSVRKVSFSTHSAKSVCSKSNIPHVVLKSAVRYIFGKEILVSCAFPPLLRCKHHMRRKSTFLH